MSAVLQVAPAFRMSTYAYNRRPQCTHMVMNRVHGDLACGICGRVPDFGWVYQCQQDDQIPQDAPLPDQECLPIVPDSCGYFEAKAQVAQHLQMNPSVVEGIRRGDYDIDQIEKLISQKENLISVILEKERQLDKDATPSVRTSFNAHSIISSSGSAFQAPYQNCRVSASSPTAQASLPAFPQSETMFGTPTKQDSVLGKRSRTKCCYQVCHSCRPYFGDRAYCSFESVLNGEQQRFDDLQGLPIMDANVLRTISLRKSSPHVLRSFQSQQSMEITAHDSTTDTSTQISVDWTPTNTNIEDDMQLDSAELFPCPGPAQCPVWSRKSGCAYDAGFDDGRRAENHGFLARVTPENSLSHLTNAMNSTPGETCSTASSISLPTPNRSPLAPLKANSVCGELNGENQKIGLRRKHSISSFGGEVEVEGGVALTEEAVQDRVPDIVTHE